MPWLSSGEDDALARTSYFQAVPVYGAIRSLSPFYLFVLFFVLLARSTSSLYELVLFAHSIRPAVLDRGAALEAK